MKIKINWKMYVAFFIIIGGLYYITRSWLITSGIMVILLLIDGFLREYENKKRGEQQAKDILERLNRDEEKLDKDEK